MPIWLKLALPACGATLFATLAWVVWRAHSREVAALEARENLLRKETAASHERLREWLSGAAHALSQPLTTLHGTLELALRSKAIPAEAHPTLETALEQVQSAMGMTRLLREVADAETSGNFAQTASLAPLLEDCREDLEAIAQAHGVRLSLRCDAASQVFASPADLRRAIHHLVEHALQRSPAGGAVRITSEEEAGTASIVIRDEGPGITAQDLAHWFEPFYSGREGALSKLEAFRLAVVERICASCGGSVAAANHDAGGARFILRLPRTNSGTSQTIQKPQGKTVIQSRAHPKTSRYQNGNS